MTKTIDSTRETMIRIWKLEKQLKEREDYISHLHKVNLNLTKKLDEFYDKFYPKVTINSDISFEPIHNQYILRWRMKPVGWNQILPYPTSVFSDTARQAIIRNGYKNLLKHVRSSYLEAWKLEMETSRQVEMKIAKAKRA